MLGKIEERADITARFGFIPEVEYARVLIGKTYLDNGPLLKQGAKQLTDMVTIRQLHLIIPNEKFFKQDMRKYMGMFYGNEKLIRLGHMYLKYLDTFWVTKYF